MEDNELYIQALKAKNNAYAPYSNFRVGAAVLMGNNKVYKGANIENSSYGATVCAERNAIFKAVYEGDREIKAIAIASDDTSRTILPCGICLQVIGEFGNDDTKIICGKSADKYEVVALKDLMPKRFEL